MRRESMRVPSALGPLLALALLALPAPRAAAQEAGGPIVAVFEIEDTRPAKVRLSDRERADLTAYLSAALIEGGSYRVVPPEQLRAALQEKKRESFKQCFDERCQIEVGKEVSAQKTLATRIMQVGSLCAIVATLYDLRQAASERATTHKGACDRSQLFEGLEAVARSLRGTAVGTAVIEKPVDGGARKPEPTAAEKLYQEGVAALQAGNVDAALQSFAAAEKAGFGDWKLANDLYQQWGEIYRSQKQDPAKATEKFQHCVEISQDKTDWPAAWCVYSLGLIAHAKGDSDRAVALFQQALAIHPAMAWNLKNDIFHMLGETYRNQRNDPARAAEFHQKAVDVSEDKSDWPAYWSEYILGYLAYLQGDADRALARCQQALVYNPNMPWNLKNDIYHVLGEIYRNQKNDPARAAEFHQKSADVSADKTDLPAFWSVYVLGLMAYHQGNADRAIALCQQSLALHPNMSWNLMNDIYHVLGESYRLLKKDSARAVEYHQKAWDVSVDKTDWPAFWSRYIVGYVAFEQGNADRAIGCFSNLKELLPRLDWKLQNDIDYFWGETYRTLKRDPGTAAPLYQECLKATLDLSDWPAYWCLFRQGQLALDAGRKGEAAEMMLRAEAAGKAEAGFVQEVDQALRAAGMR